VVPRIVRIACVELASAHRHLIFLLWRRVFLYTRRDALHAKPGFENVYNDTNARAMERLPLFCVPIPGLSPWAQPSETSCQSKVAAATAAADSSAAAKKRSRDDAMDCDQQQQQPENNTDVSAASRSADTTAARSGSSSNSSSGSNGTTSEQQAAFRYQQELQLLREAGLPCLARVYHATEDAVEFVGVLSFDDESSDAQQQQQSGDAATDDDDMQTAAFLQDGMRRQMLESAADSDMQQEVPPPSLVPRLHVITYRKVISEILVLI
jgi:Mini-chromosome maintenance replisome factor